KLSQKIQEELIASVMEVPGKVGLYSQGRGLFTGRNTQTSEILMNSDFLETISSAQRGDLVAKDTVMTFFVHELGHAAMAPFFVKGSVGKKNLGQRAQLIDRKASASDAQILGNAAKCI